MTFEFPDQLEGLPFLPVEFDRDARLVDAEQVVTLQSQVRRRGITDLLVLSHGWNNDQDEALGLYRRLLRSIHQQDHGRLDDRRLAVLGVSWPSKKFADESLIPGGAASVGDHDLPLHALEDHIDLVADLFDDETVAELRDAAGRLETSTAARASFGAILQRALAADAAVTEELADEIPDEFFAMPEELVLDALVAGDDGDPVGHVGGAVPVGGVVSVDSPPGASSAPGGALGGATGIGDLFRGIRSAASNALNLTTYWAMKRRAGDVGASALSPVLRSLGSDDLPRLHLVGHSFGGRLVTACALGEPDAPGPQVATLVLLQAAFSHHGFAEDFQRDRDGYFRGVLTEGRVAGPVLVTHTSNDKPNRWAYPMASRLARQVGSALGDEDSIYGAIGANGAQSTPDTDEGELLRTDRTYDFTPGRVHNLESSAFIPDHGTVHRAEVAHAIVSAIVTPATPE